jgi:hypothetical protein
MEMKMKMEILGSGKDGIVVYPPLDCIDDGNDIHFDKTKFVGKIYFKGRANDHVNSITTKINELPNKYDNVLYYKENYVCQINDSEKLQNFGNNGKRLSNTQLILKRVDGITLQKAINETINNIKQGNYCMFYELLNASIKAYYHIKDLSEVFDTFYNDYSTDNVMYEPSNKRIVLIDLDDITKGQTKELDMGKNNLFNIISKPYLLDYVNDVILTIIKHSLGAYDPETDDYLVNTLDETEKDNFINLVKIIEEETKQNFDYSKINYSDIDIDTLNSDLESLKSKLCDIKGGKKSKENKCNKSKKNKKSKKSKKNKKSKKSKKRNKNKTKKI